MAFYGFNTPCCGTSVIWSVFQDFQHHTPSPGWSVLRLCLGNLCCPTGCSFCSTAVLVLSMLFSSMFLMALLSSSVAPWSECLAKPWHLAKQWALSTLFWQISMSSLYLALFLLNASSSWSSQGTVSPAGPLASTILTLEPCQVWV